MHETWETDLTLEEQYEDLIAAMQAWQKNYDEGHPTISDMEWDDYYTRLLRLEKKLGYVNPESPSQKIHYDVVNELKKVEHNHPMLSLDKTKDINDIYSFIEDKDAICMAKMDGLTCSLHYCGGRLVRAETRGNGLIGEDITHNAWVIPTIPKTIDSMYDTVVDGEIICTYNDFNEFAADYSNPRNFAAGSIRLLDSNECAKRKLQFIAWDMINGYDNFNKERYSTYTLAGKLKALKDLGFSVVPCAAPLFEYGENWEHTIAWIKTTCDMAAYPIDGLVFKYNNCKEYEEAGRTEHHFKGGLAYKFYDELYETELRDIEWSMGRTGVLTPIAIFKEIDIDGAKISRASLHNVSVMNELLGQPFLGQKLRIFRANQIIPQVYDAENSPYTVSTLRVKVCPICGTEVEMINNDGVINAYCPNENCEGKLINKFDHFCGKKGLDIKGLSKATLEKLISYNWLEDFTDIFKLKNHRTEWINKPGFGEKSVDKILTSIDNSCTASFESFLSSLGISLIGRTVARQLANTFIDYADFRNEINNNYDFTKLPDFGLAKHNALISYDYTIADELYDNYLKLNYPSNEGNANKEDIFANLTFVVTGKLGIHFKTREEIKKFIEAGGGRVTESVSTKTSYLINNDKESNSAKNKTAQKLGIEILTESEFVNKFIKFDN